MLSRSRLLALPLACALSGAAAAQTTHVVNLVGTAFSQPNLTIAVGDTVQWVWLSGMHNVESGVEGVPDGNFTSGPATFPPNTFSVTFDAAFLAANPMPGKVYPYYCSVHVDLGMDGQVTVAFPSSQAPRNAGSNPSSVTTAGMPKTGTSMFVFVDLTTTGHSSALLFGFDTPIALTLAGGQTLLCLDVGGNGELLSKSIQPGPTALFGLSIPNLPSLCGFTFCMQAIHLGGVVPFALSNAVDVTVGNS
jgi:plastocyanin